MFRHITILTALVCALVGQKAFAQPKTLTVKNAHGFVFEPWQGNDLSEQDIKSRLKTIAGTGARHITFLVFVCQKDQFSSDANNCGSFKQNLESRIRWAKWAKEMGMEVDLTLFPRVNDWSVWRGKFKPTNVRDWFISYTKVLKEVANASEKLGTSHLTVATEMQSLYKHTEYWQAMVQTMRLFYTGPMTINSSWTSAFRAFWKTVDYISFSAYFPLSPRKNPSVWELRAAWKPYKAIIKSMSLVNNRPVMFAEIGYQSKVGAARIPSDFDPGPQDLDIQKKLYKAFYKEWKNSEVLEKFVIWATEGVEFKDGDDYSYNPIGKPAMEYIRPFFVNH
jgi:hypothetical protein